MSLETLFAFQIMFINIHVETAATSFRKGTGGTYNLPDPFAGSEKTIAKSPEVTPSIEQ